MTDSNELLNASSYRLFLVRHGRTSWNDEGRLMGRIDIGLNDNGRDEAEDAAAALSQLSLTTVYTSPRCRASATAQIIAAHQSDCGVTIEDRIDETNAARWAGKRRDELVHDSDFHAFRKNPLHIADGVETTTSVEARIVSFLTEIERKHCDHENIAIVSHAAPIRIMLAYFLRIPLTHFKRLVTETGPISVVTYHAGECQLTRLGLKTEALRMIDSLPNLEPNAL